MSLILASIVPEYVCGHNWVNHPSRAAKVSTTKPCPQRQKLQQTHVQANPGQSIPVEWATGHTGSTGWVVLVDAGDEERLNEFTDKIGQEYLREAAKTRSVPIFHVSR